jgi:hypothetical protein
VKQELKIAMVIDDYKLKNKADWWVKSLAQKPEIEKNYDLVREEIGAGVTANTLTCYRFYKLKAPNGGN